MKLRILNNSIRLRLSQGEINEILDGKSVYSMTQLPGDQSGFQYSLELFSATEVKVLLQGHNLKIYVPEEDALNWARTDRISLESNLDLGYGDFLNILIEKDFKCLQVRENEDESDLFPNPNQVEKTTEHTPK